MVKNLLAEFLKLPLYLITSYDSWQEDNIDFTIDTPIWCPLKNYGDITVKIKQYEWRTIGLYSVQIY